MRVPIQVPVTFDSANRRKDRSVRMAFSTNLEISTEDYSEMDKLSQQAGWLLFSPNELQVVDVPTEPATTDLKRHSVRLRGAIYVNWQAMKFAKKTTLSAEEFYAAHMDRIIEWYKARFLG